MTFSRRDFGKTTLGGIALAGLSLAKTTGVTLGVMTYSYRALPQVPGTDRVDGEVEALKANSARDIEFYERELQPPDQAADLEKWRNASQLSRLSLIKKKVDAAGVIMHAYCVNYKPILTDDDLDATFQQAR